ncbi:MAG: ABC transporter ATP-binding protein [Actinocatenispora sp.]
MTALTLESVTKVFPDGTVAVDGVELAVTDGEVMVLLGPSGCGKSTILRMIAGLDKPTEGQVLFDDEVVDDWTPRERRVAMAFQDFALYPHMSVHDNLAFPLRLAGLPAEGLTERVTDLATALGVADTLARRPGQLSGGQKQRVAMGRAIIREPRIFLLDEPLSNLDSALRHGLRAEISSLVRTVGVTTVYVTHDQTEALTMADRIAILREGRLQQVGEPNDVYHRPATVFVAAFLGHPMMNLLEASVYAYLDDQLMFDMGHQHVSLPWSDPRVRPLARYHGERVIIGLRAESVTPVADGTPGAVRGIVRYAEHLGHETIAYLDIGAVAAPGLDELTGAGHQPPPPQVAQLKRWRFRGRREQQQPAPQPEPLDLSAGRHVQRPAEFAIRLPPYTSVSPGTRMSLQLDLTHLHVFDRRGDRIHSTWLR